MNLLISEIVAAIQTARQRDSDWQACMCEVARIPAVEAAWRAANSQRQLSVIRVDGIPHIGFEREGNMARGKAGTWGEVSGYLLDYGIPGLHWNQVRPNSYAHSAHSTWDGICRETYHGMIEIARNLGHLFESGMAVNPEAFAVSRRRLAEYGITIIDDTELAA
jgi:hypothetical protein